jgi:hypothetical protein
VVVIRANTGRPGSDPADRSYCASANPVLASVRGKKRVVRRPEPATDHAHRSSRRLELVGTNRRIKDGLHRYILRPDPTPEEANQLWGVPVLVTARCNPGDGLLIAPPISLQFTGLDLPGTKSASIFPSRPGVGRAVLAIAGSRSGRLKVFGACQTCGTKPSENARFATAALTGRRQ